MLNLAAAGALASSSDRHIKNTRRVNSASSQESVASAASHVKKVLLLEDRIELTVSEYPEFEVFSLIDPDRLVLDLKNGSLNPALLSGEDLNKSPSYRTPKFIRASNQTEDGRTDANPRKRLRMVFGLEKKSNITLVGITRLNIANGSELWKISLRLSSGGRIKNRIKPLIAIDPGHGGKDPGTISDGKISEKTIALAQALELKKQLEQSGRYRTILTRSVDEFIPLQIRTEKARKSKADIFISLHADSSPDKKKSGMSIYTLSEKSSDHQAEMLALKENKSDIISGADLKGAPKEILDVIISLSQRESMNRSAEFANLVVSSMKDNGISVIDKAHRFAGFAVLTAPDMASVLIEIGYLSSHDEEKKLSKASYRMAIGKSLVSAIDEYFMQHGSRD